jgi:hypothetical protein
MLNYTTKVKNDISIPTIKLGRVLNSKYRMTVDVTRQWENFLCSQRATAYLFYKTTAAAIAASVQDTFFYVQSNWVTVETINKTWN